MPRRQRNNCAKIITAVFAVGFVASLISTYVAVAAANLFKIQNAELSDLSATATGAITSFDEANIVSDVTFHTLDDSAKYTVILKNTDEKDHVIESITDDNENPYINYVYDSHAGEQIDAGSELVFVVTAKYANAVTDTSKRAVASNVKFYIKYTDVVEPDEETIVVPNTGINTKLSDNMHFSMVALIISATGLIIIGIVTLKKHKKASKFIIAAIVTVSAVAAAATVKAATVEVNSFTLTTNYTLKDRLVVTWTDANGNEHEEVVNYNEPANISDPQKEGHTFTGWVDEDGNPVDPSEPIVDDIKIFPTFRANTYTIRFNANGGDGTMADLAMTFGEPKNLPANAFTWDGRTYTGWDTEANGSGAHYGDEAEATNLTTEDNAVVTLYAQWSINPFHIDYDGNGATSGEMATTNCEYDESCILRNNAFAKTGYDFAGWEYNGTIYANKADVKNIITIGTITMVAQWTVHVYSIEYTGLTTEEAATLRAQGNPDEYTIETGAFTLIKPADRKDADGDVRQHCIGWRDITVYTDITLPIANALGDKKYEAVWQTVALPEYNITYDYGGGDVTTANPVKHNKEQSFTLNEPVKEGYTFVGWTGTTIEGSTPVKPYTLPAPHVRSDIEFTAHYRKNGYQVAFNINTDDTHVSGNMANMTGLEYDTDYNLTANAFTRTGYTFAGWNRQADGQGTDYADAQPFRNLTAEDGATVTLYAKWNPIHYTIVFHENSDGVTGDMANQVFTYDEEKQLTQNAFVKDHYKFMGWTTVANGTGTKYDDQASIINLASVDGTTIDLYAQWKERTAYLKGTVNNSWGSAGDMIRSLPGYANATAFRHYESEPNFDEIGTKYNMAISSSNFPVYTWIDGETIYWWSEAETIYAHEDSRNFFSGLAKAETIDYSGFNFSLTKNLAGFFRNTAALSTIDLSPLAAANPTTLAEMFYGSGITSANLSPLSTENVTTMKDMFNGANKLTSVDLSAINTANVEDMSGLFMSCTNFESVDFSHNNLSSLQNTSNMFRGDKKLTSIDFTGVNTPNLENMEWMFGGAKIASLDLSDLDTGNVTGFGEMFYGANIENLDISGWDTSSATHLGSMFTSFNGHGQVLDLSHFDTSNVSRSMYEMFNGTNVSVIDLSSFNIDAERAANIGMENLFHFTNAVETIYATENLHFNPNANLNVPADYGGQSKLVGGAGSTLAKLTLLGIATNDRARIDDPCNGKPGMFAVKNAQYICYNANIPSGETGAGSKAGEYLSVGTGNLMNNTFVRDGYNFAGWVDDDNNNYVDGAEVTIAAESKTPLNLYAVWEPKTLTITFDKNDTYAEGEMGTQTVTYTATETLNANTFTNYQHTFLGWNTQADGKGTHYDNHTEIEITIPHDFTLYAEWKAELEVTSMNPGEDLTMLSADKANEDVQVAEGTKCKRAIQLHEEICVSGHCTDLGYTETGSKGTNVVRYGSFGTQGGPLNSGDAFTCDVDGNGVFDEKYERFYYVSDYWNTNTREFEDDTAVLIYYRSTYLGQGNTVVQSASYRRDITLGPDVTNMPRNSLWRNVSLKNTERNILAFREGEEMTNEIEAGTLPSNFSYEGYSARYLTIPEAKVGCGVATIQGNSMETDSTCMYMYENSRFVINDMGRTESIGVPLENPYITHGATAESDLNRRWFIQSRNGAGFQNGWTSSRISARPVIEVPKNKISY